MSASTSLVHTVLPHANAPGALAAQPRKTGHGHLYNEVLE